MNSSTLVSEFASVLPENKLNRANESHASTHDIHGKSHAGNPSSGSVQEGVIPRNRLPEVLSQINQISEECGLRIANNFHAGDGNLHPLVLFDARKLGEIELALKAGSACLKACTDVGGTITGEHGIGIEKIEEMRFVFNESEINAQTDVREVFNPQNLLNSGKLFPSPGRCAEVKKSMKAVTL